MGGCLIVVRHLIEYYRNICFYRLNLNRSNCFPCTFCGLHFTNHISYFHSKYISFTQFIHFRGRILAFATARSRAWGGLVPPMRKPWLWRCHPLFPGDPSKNDDCCNVNLVLPPSVPPHHPLFPFISTSWFLSKKCGKCHRISSVDCTVKFS